MPFFSLMDLGVWAEGGWSQRRSVRRFGRVLSPLLGLSCVLAVGLGAGVARASDLDLCAPVEGAVSKKAMKRGTALLDEGDAPRAASVLKKLASDHPQDAVVRYHWARVVLSQGERSQALKILEAAHSLNPDCIPVVIQLGRLLESEKAQTRALELYEAALKLQPEQLELRKLAANLWLADGLLSRAEPHLRRIATDRPGDADAQAAWADVLGWMGKSKESVAAYERALKLNAKVMTLDRRRTFAAALYDTGRLEESYTQYSRALRGRPRDVATLTGIGQVAIELGKTGKGLEFFRRAVAHAPKDAETRAGLARALTAHGRHGEATAAYRAAIRLAPDDQQLRLEAAQVIAGDASRRDVAVKLLEPLTDSDDASIELRLAAAEILSWEPSRRWEALEVLDRIIAREHENEKAWMLARQTALWIPPEPALIPWMERLVTRFSEDYPVAMHHASSLAQDTLRMTEAIGAFEKVLALDEGNGEARIALAELKLTASGGAPEALLLDFRRGADDAKSDGNLQARAGFGFLRLNHPEEAISFFDRALTIVPHHQGAIIGKAEALIGLGQRDEGLKLLDEARRHARKPSEKKVFAIQRTRLVNKHDRDRARTLVAAGKFREAEASYRTLLRRNPKDVDAWVSLGALQAQRRLYGPAFRNFQRALALDPAHPGALRGASGALIALKRPSEALKILQAENKVAPSADAQQRLRRAEILVQVEEVRSAPGGANAGTPLDRLGQLFLQSPQEVVVIMAYGDALLEAQNYAEAAEVYGRAIAREPDNVYALKGAAAANWRIGKRADARQLLLRARDLSHGAALKDIESQLLGWQVQEAEAAKRRGELNRALELYKQAYRTGSNRDFVLKGLAGLYWTNQQLDLATKYFYRTATLYPQDREAVSGTVETLLAQNLPDEAIAFLGEVVARGGGPVRVMMERAVRMRELRSVELAWERGERAIAVSLAREVGRKYPDSVEPWMRLARLYGMEGEYLEAVRWYHQALEVDPDHQPALLALIASLQAMDRVPEAQDLIRQARARDRSLGRVTPELNSMEAAIFATQAGGMEARGELEAALSMYERALTLEPRAIWILCRMGALYARNGQPAAALALYQLAEEQSPNFRPAIQGQANALVQVGRLDEAERVLRRMRELDGQVPPPLISQEARQRLQTQERSARLTEAEWLKQEGDLGGATRGYEALYLDDPSDLNVARGLVGCYLALERPLEALKLLSDLLAEHPFEPELLVAASVALQRIARSDLAVPILRKADRYWPSEEITKRLEMAYLEAYVEAAEAAKRRGDIDPARRYYEGALRRAPGNISVMRGLAGVEAKDGHFEVARAHYATILSVDPDDDIAVVGHAATLSSSGELQAAIDEMNEGWTRTGSLRIGLELVELLLNRGRWLEADRVLADIEQKLEDRGMAGETTLLPEPKPQAFHTVVDVVSEFEETWRYVARLAPSERVLPRSGHLPMPAVQRLRNKTQMAPGLGKVRALPEGAPPLADVDPGVPALPSSLTRHLMGQQTPSSRSPARLDLWLVEQMLRGVRSPSETPDTVPSPDVVAEASEAMGGAAGLTTRSGRRLPLEPWLYDDAMVEDQEEYTPYTPPLDTAEAVVAPEPVLWQPVLVAQKYRARLHAETATQLRLTSGFDSHTGYRGTNGLVSGYGELALRFFPMPALYLEPFVRPTMVTNGVDSDNGTAFGLNAAVRTGPFGLTAMVGSSPVGFQTAVYPLGRVRIDISGLDRLQLGVEGAVEPVRDSLLSWAGMLDGSGAGYGRVSRTRLGASIRLVLDGSTTLNLGGDLAQYSGLQLPDNGWAQGYVSVDHGIRLAENQDIRLGVDVASFGFDQQLDEFEVGQGGYFSPDLFVVTQGRAAYVGAVRGERVHYSAAAKVGGQYTVAKETDYIAPGFRPAFTVEADVTYRLNGGLNVGGHYLFDNVGGLDYSRSAGWIYVEKRFGVEN